METPAADLWQFKPVFEQRIRWERRLDRDFVEALSDNTSEGYSRTRFGFTGKNKAGDRFHVQFQIGYADVTTAGSQKLVRNADLTHLSYETVRAGWTTTVGRQNFKLGDGRLVQSQQGWGNLGRTFQGVRVRNKDWEAAAFRETVATPSNQDNQVFLVATKSSLGLTSVVHKANARTAGSTAHTTVSHLAKGKGGMLAWTVEAMGQWGKNDGRTHQAWASTANVSWAASKRTKLQLEASIASGGSGPTSGTFDSVYQSPVPAHGMRTQIGYRNLQELTLSMSHQWTKATRLDAYATATWLHDPADAWYAMSGLPNKRGSTVYRDPAGLSGNEIGQSLQVEISWDRSRHECFTGGLGVFAPGAFIRQRIGLDTKPQVWGYVAFTYRY